MDLGQRLKQARLEAGLSQRELCGDTITRNMLSQIENGSANPSMDTLRQLAARLGKPMGYFLEEQAVTSPNQGVMAQARACYPQDPKQALTILADYRPQDETFDQEYHYLSALCRIKLAEMALNREQTAYAKTLLLQAAEHGAQTIYYNSRQERHRILLCYRADPQEAKNLVSKLPDNLTETLLRADAQDDPGRRGAILDGAPSDDPQWHRLRAEAYFQRKQYAQALSHYEKATPDREVYLKMEQCCKELDDYKNAYLYAVKARE